MAISCLAHGKCIWCVAPMTCHKRYGRPLDYSAKIEEALFGDQYRELAERARNSAVCRKDTCTTPAKACKH